MPKIGDKYLVAADVGALVGPGRRELPRILPGLITYINQAHRWFLVEAPIGDGVVIRECFKF